MSAVVIVGAQWGDEGKGKATDLLGPRVDYVVKPNGGNNAGHTVVVNGQKFELKLLPAGILSENATPVIGNGVVVNPEALFAEIEGLQARGADTSKLKISANAHLVAPYHQTMDKVTERFLGKRAIGTTGRGIGPTYMDKVGRLGVRVQDILDESILRQKVEGALRQKNELLVKVYNRRHVEVNEIVDYFLSFAERLKPMIVDTTQLLNNALDEGKTLLMEGGQATFLDVDHGTYPFVTSSNCVAGAAAAGAGIGPGNLHFVLGIAKAYTTRVGSGPFPTELHDDIGKRLAERGHEFGSVTGRPRRCGWFDAVAMRRSIELNGVTALCLTKLDVLDGLDTVRICTHYDMTTPKGNIKRLERLPTGAGAVARCQAVYEEMPGWKENTRGARRWEDLPENARRYVERLAELSGAPIDIISSGPDREETIVLRHPGRKEG